MEDNIKQRLDHIMAVVNNTCSGEDWETPFFTHIGVVSSHELEDFVRPGLQLTSLVSLNGILHPKAVRVNSLVVKPGHISCRFEFQGPVGYLDGIKDLFPRFVLSEFDLKIDTQDGYELLPLTTFRVLEKRGLLTKVDSKVLQFELPYPVDVGQGKDVMLTARLNEANIFSSPRLINLSSKQEM